MSLLEQQTRDSRERYRGNASTASPKLDASTASAREPSVDAMDTPTSEHAQPGSSLPSTSGTSHGNGSDGGHSKSTVTSIKKEKAESDLSPNSADTASRLWKEGDDYRYLPKSQSDPWEKCNNAVHKQNLDEFGGWKEEVDTLLVFAGLFSAVVTAFTVQSYQLLGQSNDSNGMTVLLLVRISQQLNSSGTPPADLADPLLTTAGSESSWAPIRVNILWFLSLSLSLSAALIGILCKQWIREAQRDITTSSRKDAFRLYQLRKESLSIWGVPDILFSIPILLEIGLILFFVGLVEFLWSLNPIVAGVISAFIGLVIIFIIGITFAPAYYTLRYLRQFSSGQNTYPPLFPCAWKSPQSWLLVRLAMHCYISLRSLKETWKRVLATDSSSIISTSSAWPIEEIIDSCQSWDSLDVEMLRSVPKRKGIKDHYLEQGMKWMIKSFSFNADMMLPIFHCLQDCELEEAVSVVGSAAGQVSASFTSWDILNEELLNMYCTGITDLGPFRVEILVRRMNGTVIGPAMTSILGIWFELKQNSATLEPELCQQIADSISSYLDRGGRLMVQDLPHILHITQMLSTHPTHPIPVNIDYMSKSKKLRNPIIDALSNWVSGHSDENTHRKRVLHCIWGIQSAIASTYMQPALERSSEFARLVAVIDIAVSTSLEVGGLRVQEWKENILPRLLAETGFRIDIFSECVSKIPGTGE
ncbi:hypothetical protein GYMLUDRAFT_42081 [Collybiopsis luxurians FD-317 M1]|uniref:DUF6535 domain-containing protein n=1 Tax=Collybiopsis luxurians FD-317 M1 TaxID=944289 RepID=A0A0D0CTA5_9AGAR|nr:hypothetical protein GYMLUDRAFT_42081 [Collybiopsis luxurians FD-317 M1]